MKNKTYLFNCILNLKDLNFNHKLLLSYIIKYHLLSGKNKGYYITSKFFQIIGNRSIQTTYLLLKQLKNKSYIIIDKKKKRIFISEHTIALLNIARKNETIWKNLIKINDFILFDNYLSSVEKIVLSIFINLDEKFHSCFIKNKTISNLLNITSVYISNIVSSLIKKKKIEARYTYKGYMRDKRFITILKDEYVPDYQI
jgi:hypothetical protein